MRETDDDRTLAVVLAAADRVLIGAGAGLSAAAGYDYADPVRFAELFPALHQLGFRARYELIGRRLPPALHWGYWATHVADVRFGTDSNPVYQRLREAIGDRDHVVWTSNVDALFARNGFDPDRIFTPQGDYGLYQCETPCTRQVWGSREIIEQALAATDPRTGEVTDPAAVPTCPRCGGEVFLNVRKGPEFVEDPHMAQADVLRDWLGGIGDDERLIVLELGAGFNTPSVVRWPMERVAATIPGARLVRVNRDHAEVPTELGESGLGIATDLSDFLLGQPARGR